MKTETAPILDFISHLVSSLAWPATVLTTIFLFRRHIQTLVPLVRTVKYSDVEIRFGQELAELKRATDIGELPNSKEPAQDGQWKTLIRMAEVRPRTAIRGAWNEVDSSMRKLAAAKHVQIADAAESMPMVIGAILLNQGFISNTQYELMQKLRLLGHEAERAEPDGITTDSAAEYVGLALRLAASIDTGKES
jgi:hypothetical protein